MSLHPLSSLNSAKVHKVPGFGVEESKETFKTKFCFQIKFYAPLSNQVHGRVLPEKPADPQLINKSPHFMKPEGSLPRSKAPASCPYPEPEPSSPNIPIPLLEKSILISSFDLCLSLKSGLFPSGFRIKTLHAPFLFSIHVKCPANLILLYSITLITFGEEYGA
jgi:hypothetical protein